MREWFLVLDENDKDVANTILLEYLASTKKSTSLFSLSLIKCIIEALRLF